MLCTVTETYVWTSNHVLKTSDEFCSFAKPVIPHTIINHDEVRVISIYWNIIPLKCFSIWIVPKITTHLAKILIRWY